VKRPLSSHQEHTVQQTQAEYLINQKPRISPRVQAIIDTLQKHSDNTDFLALIEQVIRSMLGKGSEKPARNTEKRDESHTHQPVPGVTVDGDDDDVIEIKKPKNKAANG